MEGKNKKITYDEILLSEEFYAYVKQDNGEVNEYWDKILGNDIEARNEFEKALKLNNILSTARKSKYSNSTKEILLGKILDKIKSEDKSNKQVRLLKNPYVRVAASIIIILGLSFLLNLLLFKPSTSTSKAIAYNEIIVPSGEKSQVILSDGTKIWLNSESKLRYPAQFEKTLRNVYLEGEAYFDVAKNKRAKFLVNTQGIKIEVLGTVFNVKSYPGDETIETSVVEGKVKVNAGSGFKNNQPVILLASERAIYYKKADKITSSGAGDQKTTKSTIIQPKSAILISEVNIKNIICWKDHLLVFDNETFDEIAVKMARWYKIHVSIKDEELKKQRFTGKFVNNETFYQVLEAISITTPIDYKFDKNILIVSTHKRVPRRSKNQK